MKTRFPSELLIRSRCSTAERLELLPLVHFLLDCGLRARREGVLSLETIEVEDPFLKAMFQALVDGTEKEPLERTFLTLLHLSKREGKDLLERMLMVENCCSMIEGVNPRFLDWRRPGRGDGS